MDGLPLADFICICIYKGLDRGAPALILTPILL